MTSIIFITFSEANRRLHLEAGNEFACMDLHYKEIDEPR